LRLWVRGLAPLSAVKRFNDEFSSLEENMAKVWMHNADNIGVGACVLTGEAKTPKTNPVGPQATRKS
jgi:hypothetical protein